MNSMIEEWKDIEGFEGFYKISNLGNVMSMGGWCGTSKRNQMIRSTSITKDGYVKVRLMRNGKDRTSRIHRLVAEAFIPNPENKKTVNHIDGVKTNNNVVNLEWANRSEQMHHAYELGLKTAMIGSTNTQAKLTDEQVREIRKTYVRQSKEFGTVALGKKYGVTNRVIGLVVSGKAYRNVY